MSPSASSATMITAIPAKKCQLRISLKKSQTAKVAKEMEEWENGARCAKSAALEACTKQDCPARAITPNPSIVA